MPIRMLASLICAGARRPDNRDNFAPSSMPPSPVCREHARRANLSRAELRAWTWTPHLIPEGHGHFMRSPITSRSAAELGTSDMWLPVTHTQPPKTGHYIRERGIWYYYARGCSELWYNVGTTLVAQNRVDAAVQLADRTPGGMAALTSWLLGRGGPLDLTKVVKKMPRDHPAGLARWRYIDALLGGATWADLKPAFASELRLQPRYRRRILDSLAASLRLGASMWPRALSAEEANNTKIFGGESCVGACALAELAAALLLFEFIDPYVAREASAAGYDSVQMLRQPQFGYESFKRNRRWMWTVEILGLQGLEYPTAKLEARPTADLLRRLRGGSFQSPSERACVPTDCTFQCCMSCGADTPTLTRTCEEDVRTGWRANPRLGRCAHCHARRNATHQRRRTGRQGGRGAGARRGHPAAAIRRGGRRGPPASPRPPAP